MSFLEIRLLSVSLFRYEAGHSLEKCVAHLLMVAAVHLKNAFMQKGRRFSRIQDKIVFLWVALWHVSSLLAGCLGRSDTNTDLSPSLHRIELRVPVNINLSYGLVMRVLQRVRYSDLRLTTGESLLRPGTPSTLGEVFFFFQLVFQFVECFKY
jgi:hypothetical protein